MRAATRSARIDPGIAVLIEAIASTVHSQRPSRKTDWVME